MKIQVEIFSFHDRYISRIKKGGFLMDLEVEEGAKVSDVLDKFRVHSDSRGKTKVNGRAVTQDYLLKEGEKVSIFTPILAAGGG